MPALGAIRVEGPRLGNSNVSVVSPYGTACECSDPRPLPRTYVLSHRHTVCARVGQVHAPVKPTHSHTDGAHPMQHLMQHGPFCARVLRGQINPWRVCYLLTMQPFLPRHELSSRQSRPHSDIFYGLRDSAGSVTCASTSAKDTIEDDCDDKPTCAVRFTDVYMATVPAARTPNGQTCSGNDARLEIQFTCVAPTSMFSDMDFIQYTGDALEECEVGHHRSEQLLGRRTPLIAARGPWCT